MKTIYKLMLAFVFVISGAALSQNWAPLGSGTNGPVYAICGYNEDLIIGGNFGIAGGYTAYYMARWDGSNWAPMNGTLAPNGIVRTLAVYQGELIVGGDFGLRKWNGSQWSNFPGIAPSGPVYALKVWAFGSLFCGGDFTQIGGMAVSNIARWDGSAWSRLGTANFYGTNGQVRTIEATAISVFVGGVFGTAGGIQTGAVAEWYGGAWRALGSGLTGSVFTLCWALDEFNSVYAGGYFTGGTSTNIAKWDGSQWNALGTGTDSEVRAIARISPSEMLIGGDFGLAGGITATRLAKWNWRENSWSALPDGGANHRVWAISNAAVDGISSVYTGGEFFTIGGNTANHIARSLFYSVTLKRNNLHKPITDFGFAIDSARRPFDLTAEYRVTDVNLTIDTVLHTNDDDLEITITHQGITDTIIYRSGGAGDNFIRTVLNDSASIPITNGTAPFTGQFRPYKQLSAFNGTTLDGDWILAIYDRASGNTGELNSWSLDIQFESVIGITKVQSTIPNQFYLFQNYPNPFNPNTKVRFSVPNASKVKIVIYDAAGREVNTLVDQELIAGTYEADWGGGDFPSGVYFYRLTTESYSETRKMILLK